MAAKTALLACTDGSPADLLRRPPAPDRDRAGALAAAAQPGWTGRGGSAGSLSDGIYPPDGLVYAGSFPGIGVLCDQQVMAGRPSQLPAHLREPGAGRRMILHVMHSVNDWFAYAVWQDGVLLRSLSLAPGSAVAGDTGTSLPFGTPFCAGEHPVNPARALLHGIGAHAVGSAGCKALTRGVAIPRVRSLSSRPFCISIHRDLAPRMRASAAPGASADWFRG